MGSFINRHRIITAVICIIAAALVFFSLFLHYRRERVRLLDRDAFHTLSQDIRDKASEGYFESQDVLREYITGWADSVNIDYKVDSYDNIIFSRDATERKKKVSPSVVCVSYNHENAGDNAELLASAAIIASTDIESGRRTVIFFNDEGNQSRAYEGISHKYFPDNSKVIYMDYGNSSYLSLSSFRRDLSAFTIPADKEKSSCDTLVRISITGIPSDIIDTGTSSSPDVIGEMGALLSRLKTKSTIFQLADFNVESNGLMQPVSMSVDLLLNSYSVSSFTKYIDKRIKSWNKSYGSKNEGLTYTYEITEDPENIPDKVYSQDTAARLSNILYTVRLGSYKYEAGDSIPDGRAEGDICGINAAISLDKKNGYIKLGILTQAYNDEIMDKITGDNNAAAELFGCRYSVTDTVPAFSNSGSSLAKTIISTFDKVNSIIGVSGTMAIEMDNYFTPCSYIQEKSGHSDIIHIRLNSKRAANLTNMIICYIATKGNVFSL